MTPEQITLVKTSWAQVVPIAPQAAELFYGRLFELDPSVRSLFKGDLEEQGAKLMKVLGTVVNSLDKLETVLPTVTALGKRHAGYGVQSAHYDTVGSALLWTLEQGLGSAFDDPTRQAWTEAYNTVAKVMKEAAKDELATS